MNKRSRWDEGAVGMMRQRVLNAMISVTDREHRIRWRMADRAVVLWLLLSLTGCEGTTSDSPAKAGQLPTVTTATVEKTELIHTIQLNGTIEPHRIARLASPAEGPVVHLGVREGDEVTAGQVLVTIGRKTGINALILSLSNELKKEEDNLNRTRRLVEGTTLPGEELDRAQASYERVRAQLASARESARDYRISAPFPGTVLQLRVSEGDFTSPRATLVEVYDPASLVLRTAVNERYAVGITETMQADIVLDAYADRRFTGRVSRLYPYLDGRTRTRIIEIEIDDADELLPGMFGRISLALRTIPDALMVPLNALLTTPRGESILFVLQEGKAVRRKVVTGIEEKGRLQIRSGVRPGEQVVVSGHERLKEGASVRVLNGEGGSVAKEASRTQRLQNAEAGAE